MQKHVEKIKKENEIKQMNGNKLYSNYTIGAKCKCGHTHRFHSLGDCAKCDCKEFDYVTHITKNMAENKKEIEQRFIDIEARLKKLGSSIDEHYNRGFKQGSLSKEKDVLRILEEMPVVKKLKDGSQVPFKEEVALVLTAFKEELKKRIEDIEKEFNLSEKIVKKPIKNCAGIEQNHIYLYLDDVKEFIRLLEEELSSECKMCIEYPTIKDLIDKLAGDKLIN